MAHNDRRDETKRDETRRAAPSPPAPLSASAGTFRTHPRSYTGSDTHSLVRSTGDESVGGVGWWVGGLVGGLVGWWVGERRLGQERWRACKLLLTCSVMLPATEHHHQPILLRTLRKPLHLLREGGRDCDFTQRSAQRSRRGIAWHGVALHGRARTAGQGKDCMGIVGQHGTARHGTAWHGMARHGMAWHGMAWHGMAPNELKDWW